MDIISIPAHFDGKSILLDEPIELKPDTKLIVTVLSERDTEHDSWIYLSGKRLEKAYSEDEEEYSLSLLKEANPDYEGR